jgi:CheY-like chemotaxis protein
MDCQMPVMDGFTATRTIRASGAARSSVPIVALTASAQTAHLERCRDAGMDDQLTKPLDDRQLERVLSRLLASDSGSSSEQAAPRAELPAKPSLEARYRERKQSALEKIAEALRAPHISDDVAASLQSLAHQLAGVSAMFGESDFGDLASKLDDGLAAWPREERLAQVSAVYRELLAA